MTNVYITKEKIKGAMIIFIPAILVYSITIFYIMFRLTFAYILYGEFNIDLYGPSLLGLDRCSPSWGGEACHPPLNDFIYFIGWNELTRMIFVFEVIWLIILAGIYIDFNKLIGKKDGKIL